MCVLHLPFSTHGNFKQNNFFLSLFISFSQRWWYSVRIWKLTSTPNYTRIWGVPRSTEYKRDDEMVSQNVANETKKKKLVRGGCESGTENALEKKRKQSKHAKSHSIRSGNESGRTVKSTMSVTCKRFAWARTAKERRRSEVRWLFGGKLVTDFDIPSLFTFRTYSLRKCV